MRGYSRIAGVLCVVAAAELQAASVTLTRVEPSVLSTAAGQQVTFSGTGFAGTYRYRLGNERLGRSYRLNVVSLNGEGTRMIGETPAMLVGTYDAAVTELSVTGGERVLATLAAAVEVVEPCAVRSVEPSQIPREGGIAVTVLGSRFLPETVISFGSIPLLQQQWHEVIGAEPYITGIAPSLGPGEEPGYKDVYGEDWRGSSVCRLCRTWATWARFISTWSFSTTSL